MASPDFVVAGAGIIGLSLALELAGKGASVTVLEAGLAAAQTSSAAAGMLAVNDPANPAALYPLAALSASLYPGWLDHLAELSGTRVPFQTITTLQSIADNEAGRPQHEAGRQDAASSSILPNPTELLPQLVPGNHRFALLDERSVDPRQLAPALLAAVRATASITLHEHTSLTRLRAAPDGVVVDFPSGPLHTPYLIDCMGTWSPAPVRPRKGQMLAVKLPPGLDLDLTVRTDDIYIVPRTAGPAAGRAILGATVEDAGFDLTVHPLDILTLNARATRLVPALAQAELVESWSGLRPATADGLPLLGATSHQPRYVLATGHFRNGILLAPATARIMAQLLTGVATDVDLEPFSPTRPSIAH